MAEEIKTPFKIRESIRVLSNEPSLQEEQLVLSGKLLIIRPLPEGKGYMLGFCDKRTRTYRQQPISDDYVKYLLDRRKRPDDGKITDELRNEIFRLNTLYNGTTLKILRPSAKQLFFSTSPPVLVKPLLQHGFAGGGVKEACLILGQLTLALREEIAEQKLNKPFMTSEGYTALIVFTLIRGNDALEKELANKRVFPESLKTLIKEFVQRHPHMYEFKNHREFGITLGEMLRQGRVDALYTRFHMEKPEQKPAVSRKLKL